MKRFLTAMAGVALMLGACKEKPPVINYGNQVAKDTTYITAAPTAQARNVLVEEYTGGSCSNCPAAHEILKEYQAQHPGRLNVIALHIEGPQQGKPYHDAVYDLRHKDATTIATSIYGGVTNLPSAGVDRTPMDGFMKIDRSVWGAAIERGLGIPDSVNLTLESTYDSATEIATVTATIAYPVTVSFAHNLNLVLVQDSIIDVQEYPFNDLVHPYKDEEYDFVNVLRSMLTPLPLGDPILPSMTVKEPGRVVVRVYTFDAKKIAEQSVTPTKQPAFKPGHCRIIGYVTYAGTGSYRVLQSAQCKLKK